MKIRTNIKKKLKKKMKKIKHKFYSKEKELSIISSYNGHLKWGNCYHLRKKNDLIN